MRTMLTTFVTLGSLLLSSALAQQQLTVIGYNVESGGADQFRWLEVLV